MLNLIKSSIGQFTAGQVDKYANRPAFVLGTQRYSYSQFWKESSEYARRFITAGISKGEHVGIIATDRIETVLCFFGLWRIGAVVIPICTGFGKNEISKCIETADITKIIIDHSFKGIYFAELCSGLDLAANGAILTMAQEPGYGYTHISSLPMSDENILRQMEAEVTCDDYDTILFTSGSTGNSKPVLTTHYSRVNTMRTQAYCMEADCNDIFCSVLPLFHCFSLTGTVLAAISVGACTVFPADRHSDTILRTIESERCTVLTAVPTLFSALLKKQTVIHADVSSLRTGMIGGSTYKPEFFKAICDELGFNLLPSIGQTEATAGMSCGFLADDIVLRSTTLGKAFPNVSLCIKNKESEIVPAGITGELCFKGFNSMQCYYNNPEATAKAVDADGWVHTGDLGWIDSNDYLHYAGRLKDIIIRGGENITPSEIEDVISSDSRIDSVKVIGVPDKHYIEEICACIVTKGEEITENEIRTLVKSSLSDYKVPRYITFFDSFPLTGSGKVDKKAIRKSVCTQLGLVD